MLQLIYKRFKFSLRKTTLKRELIGGLITFFAMIYILPVNSNILNQNDSIIPSYGGIFVATALIAGLGSIIMGMYSNLPIGIAPGMGSNVFFASTMVKQFGMHWEHALSVVFINGLIFTMLAISGLLDKFVTSLPKSIKNAFVFGLGMYLAFIALKNSQIVEFKDNSLTIGNFSSPEVIMAILGIILIFILYVKKCKMAILITILSLSISGLILGQILKAFGNQRSFSAFQDIKWNYANFQGINSIFGKAITSLPSALKDIKFYPSIIALLFMNISGASGAIVSAGELANLEDKNGKIVGTKKGLISIGASSSLSGVFGSSTTGGFLESNAGIVYGARTGVASITVGILFLLCLPLFPLLQLMFKHNFVTSPVLVLVGAMMAQKGKDIEWKEPIIGISSFFLIIIMLFSNSILNGMAFGIVIYVILNLITNKWKDIDKFMYIFFLLFLVYIISMPFIL